MEDTNKLGKNKLIIISVIVIIIVLLVVLGIVFLNKTEKFNIQDVTSSEKLNLSKSLNTKNLVYDNPTENEGDYGLSMSINEDGKSITLNIDWDKFGPLSNMRYKGEGEKTYQIKDFSNKVYRVLIGEIGENLSGLTLIYLLDNGTVEYTPIFVVKEGTNGEKYVDFLYKKSIIVDTTKKNAVFIKHIFAHHLFISDAVNFFT